MTEHEFGGMEEFEDKENLSLDVEGEEEEEETVEWSEMRRLLQDHGIDSSKVMEMLAYELEGTTRKTQIGIDSGSKELMEAEGKKAKAVSNAAKALREAAEIDLQYASVLHKERED